MLQNRLLYYPDKADLAALLATGLQPWPSPGAFRGLLAEPAGPARGTVVVFHGNAGHAGHRGYYPAALTRLGLRVILAEYPGYGPRGGELGEGSLVSDAEGTVSLARERYGAPVLVLGESLGAAVAAQASARQKDKVAGLLLLTPWDRLVNVARLHYPWLPVKWLLKDPYDTAAHLAGFDRPVLVMVAGRDSIIPSRLGKALYDGLAAPKRLAAIEGAGHNDWIDFIGDLWWRDAIEFLLGGAIPAESSRTRQSPGPPGGAGSPRSPG